MMPQERESREDLDGEAADEGGGEATEAVGFDELVEVDAQEFRRDA